MGEFQYVGHRVPMVDARQKVTGEAVYAADLHMRGMLLGKIKRSTVPFARIAGINTEKAKALPGVKAVITAKDVVQFPYGSGIADQLPLACEYVRFIGDEIAAVAAIDEDTAEEALELIEVQYETLAPAFEVEKAMEPGAPQIHPGLAGVERNIAHHFTASRGEGRDAFQKADLIVEDSFSTQAVHPAYLEPQSCVASWDSSGKLTLWTALQSLTRSRVQIGTALGVPEHLIRMIQTYVGGGFGGKGGVPLRLYPITALLARAACRPVKVLLTRTEEFISGRVRLSEKINLKLGLKRDGTIIAKEVAMLADAGAYNAGYSRAIMNLSASRTDSLYRIPNVQADAKLIYTNKNPRGSFRAIGNPQIHFALESLIDEAAEKLGMDPAEIRLKNAVRQGDVTALGWKLKTCALSESIELAVKHSAWAAKRRKPVLDHGVGIACQVHVSGLRGMHPLYDGSAATVSIDQFGKVTIASGEGELGEGASTVFAQIAAEELGVPPEEIKIPPADTATSPYCLGIYGSRNTVLGGNAVLKAAKDARTQLLRYAAEKLQAPEDSLEIRNGKITVKGSPDRGARIAEIANYAVFRKGGSPIVGDGGYSAPEDVVIPDLKSRGNASLGYPFGTQVAEVAVDRETGKVDVLGIWFAEDSGTIINPMAAEGQVEGGVVQGIGYALTEDYLLDEGRMLNPAFKDYKIPTAPDTPPIHSIFIETNNPDSPYGAKGLGEPPLTPVAPAIANAIYNAVGIRVRELPITAEKVLRAIKQRK